MNYKTILLIIAAGYLATACSTQAVPDETQQQAYNTAVSSYTNCATTNRPYSSNDQCNAVYPSSNGSLSYNGYVYGNQHKQIIRGAVNIAESASVNTEDSVLKAAQLESNEALLRAAYLASLKTASVDELKELSAQWDQLAREAK